MADVMTIEEAKLLLSEDDLSVLNFHELNMAKKAISAAADPALKMYSDKIESFLKRYNARENVKNVAPHEYDDAYEFFGYWGYDSFDKDGKKIRVNYVDLLDTAMVEKLTSLAAKSNDQDALSNMSLQELADGFLMLDGPINSLPNVPSAAEQLALKNALITAGRQKLIDLMKNMDELRSGEFAAVIEIANAGCAKDELGNKILDDDGDDIYRLVDDKIMAYEQNYDEENDLNHFDAEFINKNSVALHRAAANVNESSILGSLSSNVNKLWDSIQIPALDKDGKVLNILNEDGSVNVDCLCDDEKKKEYLESLISSATAQVIKNNLNNPLFNKDDNNNQKDFIIDHVKKQVEIDILTMYVATGMSDNKEVVDFLRNQIDIEEPKGDQLVAGTDAQFAYNSLVSKKLSAALEDVGTANQILWDFEKYLRNKSDTDKLTISPMQFLANQADKQVELRTFRQRLQQLYKKENKTRKVELSPVGALIVRRHENKLMKLGHKVYHKSYNVAVAAKEFAKDNPGKAWELAGTLGISTAGVLVSAGFVTGGTAWAIAGAMAAHTAAKAYLYPTITEWKNMSVQPEFQKMGFMQKWQESRKAAKKNNEDLNVHRNTAVASIVGGGVGGLFAGPFGARAGAACTIAIGNFIIKQREVSRLKKLYKETGDEKYRKALYGDSNSSEIQNATGLKKVWKQTLNFMGNKKNQRNIAALGALGSVLGFGLKVANGEVDAASVVAGAKTDAAAAADSITNRTDTITNPVKFNNIADAKVQADSIAHADAVQDSIKRENLKILAEKFKLDSINNAQSHADSLANQVRLDSIAQAKAQADSIAEQLKLGNLAQAQSDSLAAVKQQLDSIAAAQAKLILDTTKVSVTDTAKFILPTDSTFQSQLDSLPPAMRAQLDTLVNKNDTAAIKTLLNGQNIKLPEAPVVAADTAKFILPTDSTFQSQLDSLPPAMRAQLDTLVNKNDTTAIKILLEEKNIKVPGLAPLTQEEVNKALEDAKKQLSEINKAIAEGKTGVVTNGGGTEYPTYEFSDNDLKDLSAHAIKILKAETANQIMEAVKAGRIPGAEGLRPEQVADTIARTEGFPAVKGGRDVLLKMLKCPDYKASPEDLKQLKETLHSIEYVKGQTMKVDIYDKATGEFCRKASVGRWGQYVGPGAGDHRYDTQVTDATHEVSCDDKPVKDHLTVINHGCKSTAYNNDQVSLEKPEPVTPVVEPTFENKTTYSYSDYVPATQTVGEPGTVVRTFSAGTMNGDPITIDPSKGETISFLDKHGNPVDSKFLEQAEFKMPKECKSVVMMVTGPDGNLKAVSVKPVDIRCENVVTEGTQKVVEASYTAPSASAVAEAAKNLGLKPGEIVTGGSYNGTTHSQMLTEHGVVHISEDAKGNRFMSLHDLNDKETTSIPKEVQQKAFEKTNFQMNALRGLNNGGNKGVNLGGAFAKTLGGKSH